VSDIPTGDGKTINLFYSVAAPLRRCELPLLQYNKHYSEAGTQRGCNVISLGSFKEDSSSHFSRWFKGTVSRDGHFLKVSTY
jgi:hypothetical protein